MRWTLFYNVEWKIRYKGWETDPTKKSELNLQVQFKFFLRFAVTLPKKFTWHWVKNSVSLAVRMDKKEGGLNLKKPDIDKLVFFKCISLREATLFS